MGGAELLAGVEPAALAAQPFAVEEVGAGKRDADAGAAKAFDRLSIEGLRGLILAEQRPRAGLDAEPPVGATGTGRLREALEGIGRGSWHPHSDGGLD